LPKCKLLVLIICLVLLFPGRAIAETAGLSGAKSNHLYLKTGSNLKIVNESVKAKLHVGFAEVTEMFEITNTSGEQKVILAFDQDVTRENSENLLSNFHAIKNNQDLVVTSATEIQNGSKILVRSFELNFLALETQKISFNYWQINSADLRGTRGFSHSLKTNNFGKIGSLSFDLELMDEISLADFEKNTNPDLDLKIEPINAKKEGKTISWAWQDIEPTFDIVTNFYWPKGDLAKMALLDQNLSLYKVQTSFDPDSAWQLTDSSYLTAWPEKDGPVVGAELNFEFDAPRKIQQINIISGKANNLADYKANNRPKEISVSVGDTSDKYLLEDKLAVQTISLKKPLESDKIKMTIDSVYAGSIQNNKTYISDVEFLDEPADKPVSEPVLEKHPFRDFFAGIWRAIVGFFTRLF